MRKNQANQIGTITMVQEKVLNKGKNTLYLILKPKNFEEQIIDDINEEVENRFKDYIKKMAPKLLNSEFDDNENCLKYIMLRGYIKILNQMLKEIRLTLSPKDKMIIDKELESDKNQNKKEIFPNNSNKNNNNSNYNIYFK